ncbi:MAG: DUF4037 domain-containing protein, partial [Oscillospiraceae bacterium]|nr:DUF4037 domain-containing protein [Oscillospiraceae bacterium]
MNGLKLTREYFKSTAEPSLKTYFPALYPRLAAGLVGNGSECLGYDDELSRDHDWGIDFFIWTTEADKGFIPKLSEWKLDLFETSPPEFSPVRSGYGAQTGVMTCGGFYQSLIGAPEGPKTLGEWLRVPEENFALATNGEVFIDGAGEFSKTRNSLQKHYPEDLRKK